MEATVGFWEGVLLFFAFGTWAFWAVVVLLSGILLNRIEDEDIGITTVIFFAMFAFVEWVAKFSIISLVIAHPLIYIGGYVGAGIVYGFVKWGFHLTKFRVRYLNAKREFAVRHSLDQDFNPNDLKDGDRYLRLGWDDARRNARVSEMPVASKSKSLITMWMMYWPWSLFWTLVREFVVKLWDNLYELFSKSFQRIADSILGDRIKKDFGL